MKKNLLIAIILIFLSLANIVKAQFNSDSSQTFFVCDTTGSQFSVSAFADGNGGTYSFWIDKRSGAAGTGIYGQHLDSLGFPLWTTNGKFFAQANLKDVWLMKAISWQNGILLAWVQGGFGIGGDTLFCNYYDYDGISQWSQPTLVANKQGNIIYVNFDDLNIFPNDSGATVTFGLTPSGGNNYFSFNRVDFAGNLRWPVDSFYYQGNGYYYITVSDNYNGFYVATSTGGLGYDIYLGHFDLQGNQTIPVPVDVCGTAGGRGNSAWKVVCDADTNAYIVWASYTSSDISISKIKPDGTLPWSDAKSVCNAAGVQDIPDAIIDGNIIYVAWNDGRPGAANAYIYMQKLDTAGNDLWSPDGVEISNLNSYIPYPKLVKSGSNVFVTYVVTGGYRAQQIRPDSSVVWQQNGVVVNVNSPPFYADHQLVSAADGCVTAIWREASDNICAIRVRPNGSLTKITELSENTFSLFPNPATDQFQVQLSKLNHGNVALRIYNSIGELIFEKQDGVDANGMISISTSDFSPGFYFVKVEGDNYNSTAKVCVVRE